MNSNRLTSFFREYPAVSNLIVINLLFWLASIILPTKAGIDVIKILGMHYWQSDLFNPLQMISYMFLHDTHSFSHIFFNMFGVYMFGRILEHVWGTKKFLFYYLLTGFGAAIIQQVFWAIDLSGVTSALNTTIANNSGEALIPFQHLFRGDVSQATAADAIQLKQMLFNAPVTIGASGALFGLLLAFGWLFPNIKLYVMFIPIPISARIFVILYGVAELFLGIANFSGDSVAHFAHLGGMIFGALIILYWKKKGRLFS
ncbi:MAG: rhomboid family intramembrane serine protease [Sphingobacteriia bacterium]|jgi:membrane associated rhomboid family serine protease|nr:rhomboid family intramembrane serine protease [Paludibacteraceae bacterium]NCA79649.1 rhomboid family intramembrane serine protease [Sphingobacteriia bacterium]